jgi:hypothetical protein
MVFHQFVRSKLWWIWEELFTMQGPGLPNSPATTAAGCSTVENKKKPRARIYSQIPPLRCSSRLLHRNLPLSMAAMHTSVDHLRCEALNVIHESAKPWKFILEERGAEGRHLGGDRGQPQVALLPRQGPACLGIRELFVRDLGRDVLREQR